jgi:meiotic recombination protein SPO11
MALVDGDAYGLDIVSVYKFGSSRMQHENEHLTADRIEWIGLWSSELEQYVVTGFVRVAGINLSGGRLDIDQSALIPASVHDVKKVRISMRYTMLPPHAVSQAQTMLARSDAVMPVKWRYVPHALIRYQRSALFRLLPVASSSLRSWC